MKKEKECARCKKFFKPNHGNSIYCSEVCYGEMKKDRQWKNRDPIKKFLPIMTKNHAQLERMFTEGITDTTATQIEANGIDLSLCRHMKPSSEHEGKILLDFGTYFLLTDTQFLKFKILPHDTLTHESI